jgi:hypothetical protein
MQLIKTGLLTATILQGKRRNNTWQHESSDQYFHCIAARLAH